MTTLYVQYCTRNRLPCTLVENASVVICLQDSALVAPTGCPDDDSRDYVGPYIFATICQAYTNSSDCGNTLWTYTLAYDSDDLADVDVPISTGDITGVNCYECIHSYLDYRIGNETYLRTNINGSQSLITQHGCEYLLNASVGALIFVEVTTAELNALVGGAALIPGVTYVITNHSQNRLPPGTRIGLTAIGTTNISTLCSVLTSFDTDGWWGTYELSTNKLIELHDNQGNVCRQYPSSSTVYTCVDDFDWGNPNIRNCTVDNATWVIDYGITGVDIDAVSLSNGATLDMTGWSGTILQSVSIDSPYTVELFGTTEMQQVEFSQATLGADTSTFNDTVAGNTLAGVKVTTGSITVGPNIQYSINNSQVSNGGSITLAGSGIFFADSISVDTLSAIVTAGTFAPSVALETVSMQGDSLISIAGVTGNSFSLSKCDMTAGAALTVNTTGFSSNSNLRLSNGGTLNITGVSDVNRTDISMGTLNTGGYDLSGVYLYGVATKTCTANNTNKGKDYFNDNIV
jgi:hypothetical protein